MPRVVEEPAPRRPAYFWWLLANILAACFALTSWVVCLNIFRHPENPRNYEILRKLKRLPELKRYKALDAPTANSLSPRDLYKKFNGFDDAKLARLNPALLRNYLTNFERPLLLTYVEGNYKVQSVRPLHDDTSKDADFFAPGFVVRGRAMVKPDEFTPVQPYPVIIEYLFPTADRAAFSWFKPDDMLTVTKAQNCAAVLHVSKVEEKDDQGKPEQILCVTVVPIVYGDYQVGDDRVLSLDPPDHFKPGAKFPLFK
ncbi:hypothetical protein [Luteolibacter sp. LG18]|uniref:hypothetical protein n=1 Tax=Luteolibacter sp. LG18 TaxID=2819286 RepID=UPI002B31FD62|nr:hypothetical protein llg_34190 [Luteolibacter sp. LG18]